MGTAMQPAGAQASLNDLLTARVRGFLAEVLPDEMVQEFANKAVAQFITDVDEPHPDRYARDRGERVKKESEMTKLTREIVSRELSARVGLQLQQIVPRIVDDIATPEKTRELAMEVIERLGPALLRGLVMSIAEPLSIDLHNNIIKLINKLHDRGITL